MRHRPSAVDSGMAHADELFRTRLENQIDLRHPLARLAGRMAWSELEEVLSVALPPAPVRGGRPALPVRLMAGLLYLKHAYDVSDEEVCVRWLENPYWQFFTGEVVFQTTLPCDPSSLTRWRQRLGEAGMEALLAYPTDSRLLEVARRKLVLLSKRHDLRLRQTYEREGPGLSRKAGRHAHARQFKRMRRVLRRQRTLLGRVIRDIGRKLDTLNTTARAQMEVWLERAGRIFKQRPQDKNKLYALHAAEVECIGKGKSRQPYEFGVKVGIAVTARQGLIVGARSFAGNPYDGDTLAEQLEQAEIVSGHKPTTVIVDLGYRGRQVEGVQVLHRGKPKTLTRRQWRWVKRRQAIEPVIGHLKDDCRMRRCHLRGVQGDALHAIACAAGNNLRWLMRWIVLLCAWIRAALLRSTQWQRQMQITIHC